MITITTLPPKFKVLNRDKWYLAKEILMYNDGSWGVTMLQGKPGYDSEHTTAICPTTGLVDASEEKIELFLGDVIESIDSQGIPMRHVIIWDKPCASFGCKFISNNIDANQPMSPLKQEWIDYCNKKFIGNAFEFPELLKPVEK